MSYVTMSRLVDSSRLQEICWSLRKENFEPQTQEREEVHSYFWDKISHLQSVSDKNKKETCMKQHVEEITGKKERVQQNPTRGNYLSSLHYWSKYMHQWNKETADLLPQHTSIHPKWIKMILQVVMRQGYFISRIDFTGFCTGEDLKESHLRQRGLSQKRVSSFDVAKRKK